MTEIPQSVPALNVAPFSSPLVNSFEQQDEIFSSAFAILEEASAHRAFPAASIAVTHRGRLVALKGLGHFTYDNEVTENATAGAARFFRSLLDLALTEKEAGAPSFASFAKGGQAAVDATALFDLASLTKVVATTPMAMILYERGLLDLDAPVAAVVPEFTADAAKDTRRHQVTLRQLLTHSSGLPAYERLFLKSRTRDELLHAAFTTPLAADPATRAEYSDIGFIILGVALERMADGPLDRFCQREIFAPLAMINTTFNPPAEVRPRIPPTADEREDSCGAGAPARELPAQHEISSTSVRSTFRHKIIQGEVQDENAFILGGVAPHAGLFSTAQDLAKYAHAMLTGGHPILRSETIAIFTRRESVPRGTSRALGWDTPSAPSQSGKYFSPQSYGHLGYTGTSLWIDSTRQLSITLLTNRTWPDCSNHAIKTIRPKFHDAIIAALDAI
jgi:CubicO group peptidase (beta-lactamase class C family)